MVDDDPDTALVVRLILERHNYQVDVFTDSKLALSEFQPKKYSLAVIDLKMNGIDGFELYERLFEMDSRMRVCFMSGFEYSESISKFQNNHCEVSLECFLKKPLSIDRFVNLVKRMTAASTIPQIDGSENADATAATQKVTRQAAGTLV